MNAYAPGSTYYGGFVTQNSEGGAVNADLLPTATANINGSDDPSFVLTVGNLDTGRYGVSGTVPSGYAAGDRVKVYVSASVGGIAAKALMDEFTVTQVREIIEDMSEYATDHWRLKPAAVQGVFLVDMVSVEAEAGRNTLCAIVLGAFHFSVTDGLWTIYRTDDLTTFTTWTTTVDTHLSPVSGARTPTP